MKHIEYLLTLGILLIISIPCLGQYSYSIQVRDSLTKRPIENVLILDTKGKYLCETHFHGKAWFESSQSSMLVVCNLLGYQKKTYFVSAALQDMKVIYMSPDTQSYREAVVHASKLVQNLSQSQLRNESIRRSDESKSMLPSANTVQDVVSNLATTQSIEDPLTGSSIGINGLGGENVKLLIDGQPVAGRMAGNIDFSQFSLSDIQEVQVYFGPQSIIYGSDASGGLINLVSFEHPQQKLTAYAQTQLESVGRYNFDGHLDFAIRKSRLGFKMGRYYFDGLSIYDTLERKKTWLPKEQYFFGGHWNHKWNTERGVFLAQARSDVYKEYLYNPGEPRISNTQMTATALDYTYETDRNNSALNFSLWGKKWNHNLQNVYSYFHRKTLSYYMDFVEDTKTETPNSGSLYDIFDLFQTRYIAQRKSEKLGIQIGAQYDQESGQGTKLINKEIRSELAAFGIVDLRVSNWHLIPGLRWNYYSTNGQQLLPAFQITNNLSEKLYIEMGYARTYRVPSLKEQYMNFVDINHNITGNPDLSPESANSINAGLKYSLDELRYALIVKLSMAYYDSRDKIVLTSIAGATNNAYTYSNVASIQNSSQTLDLTLRPNLENGELEFRSTTNWIYFAQYGTAKDKNSYFQNFYIKWFYPKWQITFTLNTKSSLSQRVFVSDVDEIVARKLNNFTMMNFGLQRDFWDHKVAMELGVKNILNVQQVPFSDGSGSVGVGGGAHGTSGAGVLASPGRSFYFRLGFSLR